MPSPAVDHGDAGKTPSSKSHDSRVNSFVLGDGLIMSVSLELAEGISTVGTGVGAQPSLGGAKESPLLTGGKLANGGDVAPYVGTDDVVVLVIVGTDEDVVTLAMVGTDEDVVSLAMVGTDEDVVSLAMVGTDEEMMLAMVGTGVATEGAKDETAGDKLDRTGDADTKSPFIGGFVGVAGGNDVPGGSVGIFTVGAGTLVLDSIITLSTQVTPKRPSGDSGSSGKLRGLYW